MLSTPQHQSSCICNVNHYEQVRCAVKVLCWTKTLRWKLEIEPVAYIKYDQVHIFELTSLKQGSHENAFFRFRSFSFSRDFKISFFAVFHFRKKSKKSFSPFFVFAVLKNIFREKTFFMKNFCPENSFSKQFYFLKNFFSRKFRN